MTHRSTKPTAAPVWYVLPSAAPSIFRDVPVVLAALALFYAFLSMTHYWLAPVNAQAEISLDPRVLPQYAMYSLLRIGISYGLSSGRCRRLRVRRCL